MAADWSEEIALAQELIAEYGRAVTLVKLSTVLLDAARPWAGTNRALDTSQGVTAVVLDYRNKDIDGELVKKGDSRALVAPLSNGTVLEGYDLLRDGAKEWKIVKIEIVKPGTDILLYKFQLRR